MIGWSLIGLAAGALVLAIMTGYGGAGYLMGFGTCLILMMGVDLLPQRDD